MLDKFLIVWYYWVIWVILEQMPVEDRAFDDVPERNGLTVAKQISSRMVVIEVDKIRFKSLKKLSSNFPWKFNPISQLHFNLVSRQFSQILWYQMNMSLGVAINHTHGLVSINTRYQIIVDGQLPLSWFFLIQLTLFELNHGPDQPRKILLLILQVITQSYIFLPHLFR